MPPYAICRYMSARTLNSPPPRVLSERIRRPSRLHSHFRCRARSFTVALSCRPRTMRRARAAPWPRLHPPVARHGRRPPRMWAGAGAGSALSHRAALASTRWTSAPAPHSSFVRFCPPPARLFGERAQGASAPHRRSGLGLTGPGGRSLRLLRRRGWRVGPYPPPPRRLRSLARAATRQAAAPSLAGGQRP